MRSLSRALAAALVVLAATPAPGRAHLRLRSSVPADSARLSAVSWEIRLSFTQPVELAFTRIELLGPDGRAIALASPAVVADSAATVVARIEGAFLAAGTYTVVWRTAGPDGHLITGRYVFRVERGAAGLAAGEPLRPARPPAEHDRAEAAMEGGVFLAASPPYVAIRWFTFTGLLGLVGAAAFRILVLGTLQRRPDAFVEPLVARAAARSEQLAFAMAATLVAAALLRLSAQSFALHGATLALEPGRIAAMLTRTTWGVGWTVQAVAAVAALLGVGIARRHPAVGWRVVAAAAVALAFTPALSGHAASATRLPALAVLADGLHVIGAGGWLGSLLAVIALGLPVALGLPREDRGPAIAGMVNAFSPTALAFAGILVATGVFAAWLQMGAASALWTTAYGRTLLLKLGVASIVFGTGAYNWRRVRPMLGSEESARRLQRSSRFELLVGIVVLAVTAVLVATPPPRESEGVTGADLGSPVAETQHTR